MWPCRSFAPPSAPAPYNGPVLLRRLSLENFRNIASLDLPFAPGRTVLHGRNAQGKTNLLEAVHLLAAAKSIRAEHERDLIAWNVLAGEIPYTRIRGDFDRGGTPLRLEVFLQLEPDGDASQDGEPRLAKRLRVNGAPRRAADFVGEMQAVLFEPQDIELVYGSPSSRRRHLDMTLSQADRPLLHDLQRYQRILTQRNHLLKSLREGRASPAELPTWDDILIESGAAIIAARAAALASLDASAARLHAQLTAGTERLRLLYAPSFPVPEGGAAHIAVAFRQALAATAARERLFGATIAGPHRDDFAFQLGGVSLAAFGSRGQHRLATVALKLAEAEYMTQRTGTQPTLLLDDILSELDADRRGFLLERVADSPQALITTADLPSLQGTLLRDAAVLEIVAGAVR
ncbi:MAG: DNA replication/repair protein RecF [Dehalococcoidia bacterium]|nr:DNA replication/repair protein RecF [Dehalococcoidia bacterium]